MITRKKLRILSTAAVKERPRWPGILGLLFALTPFWVAQFLLHYAMSVRGFHLSP